MHGSPPLSRTTHLPWRAQRSINKTRPVSYAQHIAIIDAIAARNPMKAGEAMREHLLMLQESLTRITSLDAQHAKEPPAGEAG